MFPVRIHTRLLFLLLLPCLFSLSVRAGLRDITPRPQQMGALPGGSVFFSGAPYLLLADNPTSEEQVLAAEAVRLFEERIGCTPEVVTWSQRMDVYPSIWLGTFSRFPELGAALDSADLGGLGPSQHAEEYQILVQDGRVLLGGSDLRALRWGLLSLTELISNMMGQLFVDRVYIRDWPDFRKRITAVSTPVRTSFQAGEANFGTDCAYQARMNEIEFNDNDSGIRHRSLYSIEQALLLRNKIRNYGMTLTMCAEGGAVLDKCMHESVPIHGTLMRVGNPAFSVIPTSYGASLIANGGFESWSGSRPSNWSMYSSDRYNYISRDYGIRHSGTSSIRFLGSSSTPCDVNLRQVTHFGSHRALKITFWYKMSGYMGYIQCFDEGLTQPHNRSTRWYERFTTPTTRDWTKVEVQFCTFHLDSTLLIVGPVCPTQGTLWIDDISVEAIEPQGIMRRVDTPLEVRTVRNGLTLTEGLDFRVVETGETTYDRYVETPRFERLSGSRLAIGDTVSVSWAWAFPYNGAYLYQCYSLIEPLLVYQDRVAVLDSLLHPDGFKLGMNEIAYANFDATCTRRHMTPGQIIGSYVWQQYQIIQARRPGAPVRMYGDPVDIFVFDPRAMPVTTPTWNVGVIDELPDAMEIMAMTDYTSNLDSTFTFLSNRNHRSVLAIYLEDQSNISRWFDWVQTARRYSMCDGVQVYHWSSDHNAISQWISEIGNMAWNSGPYILHGPSEYTYRPDSVVIRGEAWSDPFIGIPTASITSCRLSYRLLPNGNWSEQSMTLAGTDSYAATVRSLGQDVTDLEYYITVQDGRNLATTAPADAPSHTFVVTLPIEAGAAERMNYEEVPYRTYGAFGQTVIEWSRRNDASWFEVHRGDAPVFRADSPTLVSRQDPDSPRLLLSTHGSKAGCAESLHVYAILSSDDREPTRNYTTRK